MKRIYWLDNLRSLIIFLVVVYHVGGVYESTGMWGSFWIVDDPATISWVTIVGIIFDTFIMPAMFFIAGYLAPASLESKTGWGFIRGKIKRLLLPWLVGVLTLIPLYRVIFLYSRGLVQENLPGYFHFNNAISQNWLWFLPVLFVFSLIFLLFENSKINFSRIPLPLFALVSFILSLGFSYLIGNIAGFRSWTKTPVLDFENERLLAHFLFYIAGVLAFKRNIFADLPTKRVLYLTVNTISWIPVGLHIFLRIWPFMTSNFSVTPGYRILWFASFHLSSVAMVYLMVESFRRYLTKSGLVWNFLNRNSFGVYIIHVIVLGVFSTILLPVNLPAVVKWILTIICTYAGANLIVSGFKSIMTGLRTARLLEEAE